MSNHPEMLIDELQAQIKDMGRKLLLANELLKMIRRNSDCYAIPPHIVCSIDFVVERIEE